MTRLDKILNKVSDFLVTLQKLTGHWIWMVTGDVRSEELARALKKGWPSQLKQLRR